MFNRTVISDVPRGIANTTDSVGTESIMMSPVTTEITLESKTSGGRVSVTFGPGRDERRLKTRLRVLVST